MEQLQNEPTPVMWEDVAVPPAKVLTTDAGQVVTTDDGQAITIDP